MDEEVTKVEVMDPCKGCRSSSTRTNGNVRSTCVIASRDGAAERKRMTKYRSPGQLDGRESNHCDELITKDRSSVSNPPSAANTFASLLRRTAASPKLVRL